MNDRDVSCTGSCGEPGGVQAGSGLDALLALRSPEQRVTPLHRGCRLSVFLQKRAGCQGCQPSTASQVMTGLGRSPQIKAGGDNPLGGKGSKEQAKESETLPHALYFKNLNVI